MVETIVIHKDKTYTPIPASRKDHCTMCDGRLTGMCKYVRCRFFDSIINWKEVEMVNSHEE